MVNSYRYDPYGNATSKSEQVPNPFQFTGALLDSSTGLYKMGERYYDTSIGRFTQEDSAGGGYSYVDGNPVNFIDPSGLGKHHKKAKKHKPKPVGMLPPSPTSTPYIPLFPTSYPTPHPTLPPGPQEHSPTPPYEHAAPSVDYRTSICATYAFTLNHTGKAPLQDPPPPSATGFFFLNVLEGFFYPYYCVGH